MTRFSRDISVRVSLQLSAIVQRSNLHEDKDTMNIAVTVKNLNENGDILGAVTIYLVQISLATAKWELQPKAVYSKGSIRMIIRLVNVSSLYVFDLVSRSKASESGDLLIHSEGKPEQQRKERNNRRVSAGNCGGTGICPTLL